MNIIINFVMLLLFSSLSLFSEVIIPNVEYVAIDFSDKNGEFYNYVKIESFTNEFIISGLSIISPNKNFSAKIKEILEGDGFNSIVEITSLDSITKTRITAYNTRSGGVSINWINDKYIFVSDWVGTIACIELIVNCETGKIVSSDMGFHNGDAKSRQIDESDEIIK